MYGMLHTWTRTRFRRLFPRTPTAHTPPGPRWSRSSFRPTAAAKNREALVALPPSLPVGSGCRAGSGWIWDLDRRVGFQPQRDLDAPGGVSGACSQPAVTGGAVRIAVHQPSDQQTSRVKSTGLHSKTAHDVSDVTVLVRLRLAAREKAASHVRGL